MTADQCCCELPPVSPEGICYTCLRPRAYDLVSRLRAKAAKGGIIPIHDMTIVEAADELERLRTIVRSINRVVSQNEPYRWKVERIVATLGGSPGDVSEPQECEHLRSELLAEKRDAGQPVFEMRKCLGCGKTFRVRTSVTRTSPP